MTATEMIPAVGSTVHVRFESISIACRVIDAKTTYGKMRVYIAPLNGSGKQWVEMDRLSAFDRARIA